MMAGLRIFCNIIKKSNLKYNIWNSARSNNTRHLSYVSREYNENSDPSKHFFDKNVQKLLLHLTRIDLHKIFQKRKVGKLKDPVYEFLTDEQLIEKLNEIRTKAISLLQFPPAVVVRKPKEKVFSKDLALKGYDTSKFVFTDITFGLKDNQRLIMIRDPDGTLQEADWETRDRINQVFFPRDHRQLKIPHLFKDSYFKDVLDRKEYVFILDLACQQFEPADAEYQRVASITYQHISDNNAFEKIRSTRHFGSMTFFLVWNKMIDNLLLDLIETHCLNEAVMLIKLYAKIHNKQFCNSDNIELIEEYIKISNKKALLELALQTSKEFLKQKEIVQEGIQKAHGLD